MSNLYLLAKRLYSRAYGSHFNLFCLGAGNTSQFLNRLSAVIGDALTCPSARSNLDLACVASQNETVTIVISLRNNT